MARERERERESERERDRVQNNGQFGGEDGGWTPVLRNHRELKTNRVRNHETFTVFVDNIPENRDQVWLKRVFNKYGEVKDVFIPRKRSKRTGNKFGFVRYDCYAAVSLAISRLNGVWVDNDRLFVKEASFGLVNKRVEKCVW